MRQWYAVYTHARAEAVAESHLRRQGFTAYLPRYLHTRRHARATHKVSRPLFPRYLFVQMDPETQRWRNILSTVGVVGLVSSGTTPTPVPAHVIDELHGCEDEHGYIQMAAPARLAAGDRVSVVEGPFAERLGLVEGTTDDERVTILLEFMGRQVRVVLASKGVQVSA